MKLENNWKFKTLENLEKKYSPDLGDGETSHLITTCNKLRKKTLQDFSVEDLRIMIGQNIGLKYLVLLTIDVLSKDLFAEGDYYPGDLLKNTLEIESNFWTDYPELWHSVYTLIDNRRKEIAENNIPTDFFETLSQKASSNSKHDISAEERKRCVCKQFMFCYLRCDILLFLRGIFLTSHCTPEHFSNRRHFEMTAAPVRHKLVVN